MSGASRSLDQILEEFNTQISEKARSIDTQFTELTNSQSATFAKRVGELEEAIAIKTRESDRRTRERAERRLRALNALMERKADEASKRLRNAMILVASILFAGTSVYLNETREKATERVIELQKDISTSEASIDAEMANLRSELRESRATIDKASEDLIEKRKQLDEVSAELERARREYERLAGHSK
jgi:chromosome segregation ATPase